MHTSSEIGLLYIMTLSMTFICTVGLSLTKDGTASMIRVFPEYV